MAKLVPRVIALIVFLLVGASLAQIAIPDLGSRGDVAPDRSQEFRDLIVHFSAELRRAVAETGLEVSSAELITPGIAGSLDPEYTRLIAEIDGVRYALSGEVAAVDDARSQEPYIVNIMVVDAEQDRATDLISRPLALQDVQSVATNLAEMIAEFVAQSAALPVGDAGLFVSSQPGEVDVYVDGVRMGTTPVLDVLMLTPGRYRLELRKEGFLPEVRTVDLRSRATTIEHVQLAPIAGGSILVESDPAADVYLGDEWQGVTPLFIPAPPGVPTVRLERDGFLPAIASVPVRNYRTSRLDLQLEPAAQPLLFWAASRQYLVLIDGVIQPWAFAHNARPGVLEVEVRRGREQRTYSVRLPESGIYELILESGEVVPYER